MGLINKVDMVCLSPVGYGNLRNLPTPWEQRNSKKERTETNFQTRDLSSQRNQ